MNQVTDARTRDAGFSIDEQERLRLPPGPRIIIMVMLSVLLWVAIIHFVIRGWHYLLQLI
jgi:hypothetical protein